MRKFAVAALFAFAFLFSGMNAIAQTVSGTITDEETGDPLIGATIQIKGTSSGTATSLDGTFSFKAELGEKTLSISYVGYLKKEMDVTITEGENNIGTISLKPDAIGLQEIKVVSSYAKDRETPVSVSTIEPQDIEEKLGTKEFPEILQTTPSVYATKRGGGYGDSRINLRGFDSDNIGVLINGIPVNDMESGQVYWSNWAGLSDVTRTMQVQRGLGASKLALSSVGGTINIITKSTDAEKGGSIYMATGNNAYAKRAFTASTGLMDNNWAITLNGALTTGDGFVKATNFKGYSYFVNVSKKINDDHFLSLTAFGAPQWHNQRSTWHYADYYRNHKDGIQLNSDYGIREGKIYNTGYAYNEYHKPQISLNHNWKIDKNTSLNTSVYASFSSGGGRRVDGEKDHWLEYQYPSGEPYQITQINDQGLLDYDAVFTENANSLEGSKAVMSMAVNRHDWYGILSNYRKEIENLTITGGVDGRYYKGYHYMEVTDLLGGDYFLNASNVNRDPDTPLTEGDKYNYYNIGEVAWGGLYTQAEYVTDKYSAFINLAGSNTSYRRIDYFAYADDDPKQTSDWVNFMAYSAKGGANYNINAIHNVFANAGYFTRAPWFRYAFIGYTNEVNEGAKYEKIFSTEVGYGYSSPSLNIDLTLYRTEWIDKALTRNFSDYVANLTGLDALHQGIELVIKTKPTDKLKLDGMVSVGDWSWTDNLIAEIYDEDQNYIGTANVYAKDLKVGDAAQTTGALTVDYETFKDFNLGFTFRHVSNVYSQFDIENRTVEAEEGVQPWEMPAYEVLDARVRYNFNIGDYDATLIGNVDNLLDTEYISDAIDGVNHDIHTSPVFYGFGRTWRASLKIHF
jgi:outer membrane cobalamin receptor